VNALESWQSAVYPSTHLIRANHGSDHAPILVSTSAVCLTDTVASTVLHIEAVVSKTCALFAVWSIYTALSALAIVSLFVWQSMQCSARYLLCVHWQTSVPHDQTRVLECTQQLLTRYFIRCSTMNRAQRGCLASALVILAAVATLLEV
jgi:hypothetical protein